MPIVRPPRVDRVLHADWVVPMVPRGAVLPDHAVGLVGGRIGAVLPRRRAQQYWPTAEWSEWPGHILLPGLINAHTHAAMSLFRGLADDLPVREWLHRRIWPLEQQHVDAGFVRDGATLAAWEMLRGGTTCFNDMYAVPAATADAAQAAGIRAVIGQRLQSATSGWGGGPEDALTDGVTLLERCQREPTLSAALTLHALHTTSRERLRDAQVLSRTHALPVHMHVQETAEEVAESVERTGRRPLEILDAAGLVNSRLIAVHVTAVTEAEIQRLGAKGAHAIHCPESNLKLASGFCPVTRLRDAGVNVALGTDGAASNNDLDPWGEMRTAMGLARAVTGDRQALSAVEVLEMATCNAARALGLGEQVGALTPGRHADVIAVAPDAPRPQRPEDVMMQLVEGTDRSQVRAAWVDGECVLHDRVPQRIDEAALRERVAMWRRRLGANGVTRVDT